MTISNPVALHSSFIPPRLYHISALALCSNQYWDQRARNVYRLDANHAPVYPRELTAYTPRPLVSLGTRRAGLPVRSSTRGYRSSCPCSGRPLGEASRLPFLQPRLADNGGVYRGCCKSGQSPSSS